MTASSYWVTCPGPVVGGACTTCGASAYSMGTGTAHMRQVADVTGVVFVPGPACVVLDPREGYLASQVDPPAAIDDMPYVCPGCYAVGGEACHPGCIDAAIERERDLDDHDRGTLDDDEET